MHMLHHVNFKITVGVHLIEMARIYFTNAQLRVVGNIKSHFLSFNVFFLGIVLGQDSRPSRLSKSGVGNHHIIIMCLRRFNWA